MITHDQLPRWYPKTPTGRLVFAIFVSLVLWAFFGGVIYWTGEVMVALP